MSITEHIFTINVIYSIYINKGLPYGQDVIKKNIILYIFWNIKGFFKWNQIYWVICLHEYSYSRITSMQQ